MTGADGSDSHGASLVVPAPAKVNLFLHITGRRADGYHELESLMTCIDLCDEVILAPRVDGRIERTQPLVGIAEDDDLSVRAARALAQASGCRAGVDIAIRKRIPQGSGLGGGSSDAASVLLALNRLWALGFTRAQLAAIGLTLGADVPFFIGGTPALARGVGERLQPVTLPGLWLALACPAVAVSTASIFVAPELTRSTPSVKMNVFSEGYGRNDLQAVTAAQVPSVAEAIAALERAAAAHGSGVTRMSGSGACVFAAFGSEHDARAAASTLPRHFSACVVRTLPRHPLVRFAA